MKALVYTRAPKTLDYREAPDPEPGEDALIRVAHVGICGSDMHAWAGHDERRPAPLILGHEVSGIVIDGPGAGSRVAVNPLVTCGACAACRSGRDNLCRTRQIISMPPREGAFAELLAMPPGNLIAIPDDVPTEKAVLAEPLACGWHAVRLSQQVLDRSGRRNALSGDRRRCRRPWCCVGPERTGRVGNPHRPRPIQRAGSSWRAPADFCVYDPAAEDSPEEVDLVIDAAGFEPTRALASAAVPALLPQYGLRRSFCISGLGYTALGRTRYPPHDPSGNHVHRNLHLQRRRFPGTAAAVFAGRLGSLDWRPSRLSEGARAFADIGAGRAAAPKIVLVPEDRSGL